MGELGFKRTAIGTIPVSKVEEAGSTNSFLRCFRMNCSFAQ